MRACAGQSPIEKPEEKGKAETQPAVHRNFRFTFHYSIVRGEVCYFAASTIGLKYGINQTSQTKILNL